MKLNTVDLVTEQLTDKQVTQQFVEALNLNGYVESDERYCNGRTFVMPNIELGSKKVHVSEKNNIVRVEINGRLSRQLNNAEKAAFILIVKFGYPRDQLIKDTVL